jgi:hypothetical protein
LRRLNEVVCEASLRALVSFLRKRILYLDCMVKGFVGK